MFARRDVGVGSWWVSALGTGSGRGSNLHRKSRSLFFVSVWQRHGFLPLLASKLTQTLLWTFQINTPDDYSPSGHPQRLQPTELDLGKPSHFLTEAAENEIGQDLK